jgi:quinol-cytochrome oxidoreductase complex cytochrome b subunit
MVVIIFLNYSRTKRAALLVERLLGLFWFLVVLIYLFLTHSLDSSTVLRFVRRTARIIITITMDKLMVLNILSPKKKKAAFLRAAPVYFFF